MVMVIAVIVPTSNNRNSCCSICSISVVFDRNFTHVNPVRWPAVYVCVYGPVEDKSSLWRERNYAHQPSQLRPGTVLLNRGRLEEHPRGQIWTSSRPLCLPEGDENEPKATGRQVTWTLCTKEIHLTLSISVSFFFSAGKKDFLC